MCTSIFRRKSFFIFNNTSHWRQLFHFQTKLFNHRKRIWHISTLCERASKKIKKRQTHSFNIIFTFILYILPLVLLLLLLLLYGASSVCVSNYTQQIYIRNIIIYEFSGKWLCYSRFNVLFLHKIFNSYSKLCVSRVVERHKNRHTQRYFRDDSTIAT